MSEDRAREVLQACDVIDAFPAASNELEGRITAVGHARLMAATDDIRAGIAAMLQFASEREAIGRAAGREEMRERIIGDVSGAIPLPGNPRQVEGTRAQGMWDAVHIARAALPVDGGKGGADG